MPHGPDDPGQFVRDRDGRLVPSAMRRDRDGPLLQARQSVGRTRGPLSPPTGLESGHSPHRLSSMSAPDSALLGACSDRRARVLKHLRANGGGVAIVPTAPEAMRNRDSDYPYRHDSYFYYLTGFTEPEAVRSGRADDRGRRSFPRVRGFRRRRARSSDTRPQGRPRLDR